MAAVSVMTTLNGTVAMAKVRLLFITYLGARLYIEKGLEKTF